MLRVLIPQERRRMLNRHNAAEIGMPSRYNAAPRRATLDAICLWAAQSAPASCEATSSKYR